MLPHYICAIKRIADGEHFRATVQEELEIIQAEHGWTSGLAVPQFVIDAPGGGGRVPLLPEYVDEINDDEVIFRNFQGQRFTYKQPKPYDGSGTPDIVLNRERCKEGGKAEAEEGLRGVG